MPCEKQGFGTRPIIDLVNKHLLQSKATAFFVNNFPENAKLSVHNILLAAKCPLLHIGSITGTVSLMHVETVLDEAAEDLATGRTFYDSREQGIRDYFIDSLLSDIDSLQIFAGINSVHFGFHRILSRRFPSPYIITSIITLRG
jgi:hypothetical protein